MSKILTDEAFERTKPCREGHNCCHNNNFGGELCNDCRIDPDTDYKNLADPIFYRGYRIQMWISPQTKKSIYQAFPKTTVQFCTPIKEMDLLKELIDEQIDGKNAE